MTRFALHRVALIAGLGSLLIAGSIRLDAQNRGADQRAAADLPRRRQLRARGRLSHDQGRRRPRSHRARLRHPRGRRPAEDRVVRVRERARGRAGGRAARAQHRGRGASDCRDDEGPPVRDLPRHVLRRRRRLASAATDARQFPPPHPRARRHVRRHDAGDVGAWTSASRAEPTRSKGISRSTGSGASGIGSFRQIRWSRAICSVFPTTTFSSRAWRRR